jgi:hypothetical protein
VGDFPCLGYDDNKALSHKIIKGGIMRVGSLVNHVMWNAEIGVIYGIVYENKFLVLWLSGVRESISGDCLEVLCK